MCENCSRSDHVGVPSHLKITCGSIRSHIRDSRHLHQLVLGVLLVRLGTTTVVGSSGSHLYLCLRGFTIAKYAVRERKRCRAVVRAHLSAKTGCLHVKKVRAVRQSRKEETRRGIATPELTQALLQCRGGQDSTQPLPFRKGAPPRCRVPQRSFAPCAQ